MLRAIFYRSSSPSGVILSSIPTPVLSTVSNVPGSVSILRWFLFSLFSLVFLLFDLLMNVFRLCRDRLTGMLAGTWKEWIRGLFPVYGRNEQRTFVLVRVHAGGLNPVDAKWLYGDKVPEFLLGWVKWVVEGRVVGIDFAGVVVSAQEGSGFRCGDKVFGTVPPFQGAFAELVRVPSDQIWFMPENVSFAEASVLPLVGLTVLQCFSDNGVEKNHRILVLGASGGTGHVAVQMGKIKGAHVTAVCSSKNAAFVKSLGADRVLAYDVVNIIHEMEGSSFDLVFDTVSSHDPRDAQFDYEQKIKNAKLLKENGMYVCIGAYPTKWIYAHAKRFLGINLFPKNSLLFWVRFPLSQPYLKQLKQFVEAEKLKVVVFKKYSLTEESVNDAFAAQMNRRVVGKIVIEFIPDA